ncbi:MAG TPA: aminotransferase class V-fold PLP-dependent enzyme [Acidimicrobiia bacterium]|nr:aminotransferase class V-fold PLP-dependent enzyme [Acidimicrobiia bacterium]
MWALEPGTRHLNHGSFGAVLEEVLAIQSEWRSRLEANPSRFVFRELQTATDRARDAVAGFVGADPAGVVPVRNATTGVASVLRSVEPTLEPGDQLLTTAHDYNAVRQVLRFTAERTGAEVVVAPVPFPVEDPSQVTGAVLDAVTSRTKLAVIDHVTSPTALVYPIQDLVSALEPKTPVLVDGAHGPGQVPLALDLLGASWYTGNLHKWTCAPKGAAFLNTRSDRIASTVPTVISHGYNAPGLGPEDRYRQLFDWLGTDDFSAWAVVPEALRLVGGMETGGWEAVMKRNHDLVLEGRAVIAAAVGTTPPAPDEMVGSMASVLLPDGEGPAPLGELSPSMDPLFDAGFAALVMNWPQWPRQLLRISAHLYNTPDDYLALAAALSR